MQQWVQCVTAERGEGVEDRIVLLAPVHTKEVNYQKIFRNLDLNRSFRYIMGSEGYRLHYVVTKLGVAGIL